MGTTHAEIIRALRLTKTRDWNRKSQIWTHQTKGQISAGLMSIAESFLAQASLFFLLVSFSSVFFAAIRP